MLVQINTTYSAVVKGLTSLKCSLICYFPFIFCLNLFSIYNHDRASSGMCNILSAFSRFGDVINPSIFNHCSALWRLQCAMQTICFIFALLNANINYFLYGFRHFHICVQQVHCFVCWLPPSFQQAHNKSPSNFGKLLQFCVYMGVCVRLISCE